MESRFWKNLYAFGFIADGYLLTTPLWFVGVIAGLLTFISLNIDHNKSGSAFNEADSNE